MPELLRIGVLGAAPIAATAIVRPAQRLANVAVAAVAARDETRARRFANLHGIARAHASYDALLADRAIDAVYIALPNSLHAEWATRALQSGKHVLCEKPLAANAQEAARLADIVARSGRVLMEAFHYRYHPLAARLKAIVESGELGATEHIEAEFSVPLLQPRSIQFRYQLGGGATMDAGCYAINLLRWLAGAEPHVMHASARLIGPQVDRLMTADFGFDDGRTGRITCALLSARLLRLGASVRGTQGELRVNFPFLPHIFNHIRVETHDTVRYERVAGAPTYQYQLAAFADAALHGAPIPTSATDAVANMRAIDAVYRAAGLRVRGG